MTEMSSTTGIDAPFMPSCRHTVNSPGTSDDPRLRPRIRMALPRSLETVTRL